MTEQISNIIQIIFADIILSGDNALIIGMAASGLPPTLRRKAIFLGIPLATKKNYEGTPKKKMFNALVTITIADVSMSIDNVVAVAAIAREDTALLIFGLILAIMFMAFFATVIMKILAKYTWLSWLGLVFLLYLSTKMVLDGFPEFFKLVA